MILNMSNQLQMRFISFYVIKDPLLFFFFFSLAEHQRILYVDLQGGVKP